MHLSPRDPDLHLSHRDRAQRTRDCFTSLSGELSDDRRSELLDEVVNLNLRVATAVALRYRGRGVDEDDLQQAAAHGLVKAVLHFDTTRDKDFLTYAVPTIRGEVQRYFRDQSWVVRPPRRIQELQWRVNASVDRLTARLGRDPEVTEIIDDLQITREQYVEAVAAVGCFRPSSLDQPTRDSTGAASGPLHLGDVIASTDSDLEAVDNRLTLQAVLARLSPDEAHLLRLRFLEDKTQKEIGEEFGVAQAQVSRWLHNLLGRVRDDLERDDQVALAG